MPKKNPQLAERVLVTGGSGFLGTRLKLFYPKWFYVSSSDFDLTSLREVDKMFDLIKPEKVIHLAARVGGIADNKVHPGEFFYKNTAINTNVLESARKHGVLRVLSSLSTCAFPNRCSRYPFSEEDLFSGPPAKTNFSYGYSKRALHVQALSYRNEYGLNYSSFCPTNIYGPGDHFNSADSHFVASIISKVVHAPADSTIELWGTGKPLRQQLFVNDLCKIIPILLQKHNSSAPLIVAPIENLSIFTMAKKVLKVAGREDISIKFNGTLDGQFRKDGTNQQLLTLLKKDFKFTSFEDGVRRTIEWLKSVS